MLFSWDTHPDIKKDPREKSKRLSFLYPVGTYNNHSKGDCCTMNIIAQNFTEIKTLSQWVGFKMEQRGDKVTKLPKNPHTGYNAQSNDPQTWGTYEQAAAAVERYNLDGVGFMLCNGYFGVDLDHVIDPDTRTIKGYANDIINMLDSYTEISPSGTGVHIICKGNIPEGRSRNEYLEMYQAKTQPDGSITNGRYFTVTFNSFHTEPKPIAERTAAAAKVHKKYFPENEPQQATTSPVGTYYQATDSDDEVITKALNGRNGQRFSALWQGDTSAYSGDHSRATQALINDLVYWTNGDGGQVDRLFRQSGLYDNMKTEKGGVKKWDIRHGAKTYGEMTIDNALASFTPYTRQPKQQNTQNKPTVVTPQEETKQETPINVLDYLNGGYLGKAVKHFSSFKDRKTGYSNLDAVQPLYPGLYVLGAISSLGKTTFLHQMGDQIAKNGDPVLYFSLEQNKLEMVTKSLSRLTAQINPDKAVSAIDIRRGAMGATVADAINAYKAFAGNVFVYECNFGYTVDRIIEDVKKFMIETDKKPVVIIDYLQIIPPADPRQQTKDAVDYNVRALKKLQSDNDLVLFLIASLNRQNYLTPVDFESFKESGGIEYTADVVMGLQLAIMNDDIFNKEGKLKEKREKVKEAKKAIPRSVELVVLKNRYGVASYSCGFTYNPKFDLFIPQETAREGAAYDPKALEKSLEEWKQRNSSK